MSTRGSTNVAALAAILLAVAPSEAHHLAGHDQNPSPPANLGAVAPVHFEAGSIIIPMDGCYQRSAFLSNANVSAVVTPDTTAALKCQSNSEKDTGLMSGYSIVFKLVMAGIPVHWSIKHAKTSWNDVDFSVVKAAGSPVSKANVGAALDTTYFAGITTVKYRGAPFVISHTNAAAAIALLNSWAGICVPGACYSELDYHVSQVGFDAPIYSTITQLPKLAIVDTTDAVTALGGANTGLVKLKGSIDEAFMTPLEGIVWDYVTIPQVKAGALISGAYDLTWVPPFDLGATPTIEQINFFDALAAYADVGGSIMFQDGAIGALEGHGSYAASYTAVGAMVKNFQIAAPGGLVPNGTSGTWDNGSSSELTRGQDYSDPAAQFGGMQWTGIGGSKYNWRPRYDYAYQPGVRRMVYSDHTTNSALDNWDFATWRKKDNDPAKGTIYYLGGDNWRKNTASGFRILLNTMFATSATALNPAPPPPVITEVARSAPIVATVSGVETQYSGTFEVANPPSSATAYNGVASDNTFQFPHVLGHLRGINLGLVAEGTSTLDEVAADSAILFDAATNLPPAPGAAGCAFPATGTCRRIWTSLWTGNRTLVVSGNQATLTSYLDPSNVLTATEEQTLLSRINAGRKVGASWVPKLGGIDRSTMAVIEASPETGGAGSTRPTMIYAGGTDGMIHAICASVGQGCPSVGRELWAFMPEVELQKVKANGALIDASVKVVDLTGAWWNGTGMRTVMIFQSGNHTKTGYYDDTKIYAIDVTDPREPQVLWSNYTYGAGSDVAVGWVKTAAGLKSMTFLQSHWYWNTDYGYQPAQFVGAYDSVTGYLLWYQYLNGHWNGSTYTSAPWPAYNGYPANRSPTTPYLPKSSIPGGVSLAPLANSTIPAHVLVPSLWGSVHKLDITTGDDVYGSTPLFQMTEDFHPIGTSVSVYRDDDGSMRGVAVTGGFADPTSPSASVWAPDDAHQYAVSFPLDPDPSTIPIDEVEVLNSQLTTPLGVFIDFGAGQRGFSPAIIAGNEVFVSTDSRNINSADFGAAPPSGKLWRKNLGDTSSATYVDIPSGAASVDISAGTATLVSTGAGSVTRFTAAGFDAAGSAVEVSSVGDSTRRLWLRTE